ncbi:MAG: hypothetical protein K0Q46_4637 [Rhodococcus erythropolis]|jgi:hypothetical protein|nr:hypothetical protein [Rhodococcus erythropolis]
MLVHAATQGFTVNQVCPNIHDRHPKTVSPWGMVDAHMAADDSNWRDRGTCHRPTFDNDRPQFENIAQRLLATPDSETLDMQRIGRFEVGRVYEMLTGEVYFTDPRRGFTSESGWVYSPSHIPAGREAALPLRISADLGTGID